MKARFRTFLSALLLIVVSAGLVYAAPPLPQEAPAAVEAPSGWRVVGRFPLSPPRPQGEEIVPINGTAYWATAPTGPDFAGVSLVPFQAHNPTREVWEATREQNERYLSPYVTAENIQVSYSGWISGASHFVNDFSEVMVYMDPTDPDHLLGCSKFFYYPETYDFYTGVFESYDGGHTWTEMQPDGVEQYSLTSDPVTTFDDQGNGYFTLLTRGPTGVDMLKKPAGGDWEWPVVVDRTTSTDKQWIMGDQDPQGISPYAGNLYMSWTSFGGPVTGIVLSRSTDGNQTWSPPIALAGGSVQGSIPGVAPDGTVYVVFGRNIFYGPTPGTMEFVKSDDGGASFGPPAVAANITAIPYYLPDPFGHYRNFRSPASLPGFAVSPTNGNLYIVWSDYRHGDADIFFTRSTDGGASWDPPVRLNDDPVGNGIDQFQPQVSVAPDGRVAVMWFDRRLPCPDLPWIPTDHVGVLNGCIDTYMTRSFDDGQTWEPNIRSSAQTWDWTLNLPWTGSAGFIGDYQGIASNNCYDFPFWNATANLGENAENYQEVFVALEYLAGPADLSPSTKEVQPTVVLPGEVLTCTILLSNEGCTNTLDASMSDTLPISTSMITPSLWASAGEVGYDPAARTITWTGAISLLTEVIVRFAVTADPGLSEGAEIANQAWITDGFGNDFWRVATATVNVPPSILATDPADGAVGVPLAETVVVTFSEAMSTTSLSLTAQPDPGGWSATWVESDTVVLLAHDPLTYSTRYTLAVAAEDVEGEGLVPGPAPNPWSFTTVEAPPVIEATWPADGAVEVPLAETVVVTFSEAMSTTSLSLTAQPDPGGWSATWVESDTVVLLSHDPLTYSARYTLAVAAEDAGGQELVPGPAPNPWSFTTLAVPPSPPVIEATWPADGAVGVPLTETVVVTFSEAMSTTSLSLTAQPDPGGWSATWVESDTVVLLSHDPLTYSARYTLAVAAEDAGGQELVPGPAPNPWSFTTVEAPPVIEATWPADGAVGVPLTETVVVTFSEPMSTTSFLLVVEPVIGGWSAQWLYSDTVVLLSHAPFAYSATYTLTVGAESAEGEALVPGPVPNPWSFSTRPMVVTGYWVYLPLIVRGYGP